VARRDVSGGVWPRAQIDYRFGQWIVGRNIVDGGQRQERTKHIWTVRRIERVFNRESNVCCYLFETKLFRTSLYR
jgi:hypothetical protein